MYFIIFIDFIFQNIIKNYLININREVLLHKYLQIIYNMMKVII